ncbi:MAG: hypothetical protein VB040_06195 [Propionibacterium sp.]|nr:hypothetical protein [Propionibacterium sp.]
MSLLLKAQALQHKQMEALRTYVADIEDIDRRRHELDLASARAWMKVIHAGWTTTDLTSLGLKTPKRPRTQPRVAAGNTPGEPASPTAAPPDRETDSDG